jgi:AcrR family transcriptional regulator
MLKLLSIDALSIESWVFHPLASSSTIIVSNEMSEKRKYELKKRAERLADTRRRITEATVELHRTVGPAATHLNEVARRAGVQRMTVYNHFPNDSSLLAACSAHWRALHPTPDLAAWRAVQDPGVRLRLGLRQLYGWYRETDPMTANVLRDAQILPALQAILEGGLLRYLDQARQVLTEPIGARGRRRQRIDAAARAAVDLHTWRALAPLGDAEAADLAAGLIELAANHSTR